MLRLGRRCVRGAVHALNYASADPVRTRAAFKELAAHPHFGGWVKLVRGQGYFNAELWKRSRTT